MSLKNWMKKVETAQLNEFSPPPGSVVVPAVSGTVAGAAGTSSTPGQNGVGATILAATKPGDKSTQGIIQTLAKNKSIAVLGQQPGQTQTDTTNTNGTATTGSTAQTVGGTTQVSETGLDQVGSFHDEIQVESKPKSEISDGLRYIKDNHKHECKMYEDGWGLDESLYSSLVDHYYHEGKIPRKLMIEGGNALREFIESCYAKDTGMGGNQAAINNGMLDEEDVTEGSDQNITVYGNDQGYYAWTPDSGVLALTSAGKPQMYWDDLKGDSPQVQQYVSKYMKPMDFNILPSQAQRIIGRKLFNQGVTEGPDFNDWAASRLHLLDPANQGEDDLIRAQATADNTAARQKREVTQNITQNQSQYRDPSKMTSAEYAKYMANRRASNNPLEETSELEQMLRQSTKENTMYESKKSKKAVDEAVEKTKTGIKHKADAGGYGRKDDEEDTDDDGKKIKKVAKDEPKKGRGRPKKTDNASGEDKKFDFSAFGVNHGKDIKLKPWDKKKTTKVTKMKDGDKNDKEEVDESKLKGKQSKLDINKNGKVDGGDFAMLRGQKKKKDPQMESWDAQLKNLLIEGTPVPTSTGQAGGGSTGITSEDAGKLLQILQNAGLSVGTENSPVSSPSAAPAQVSTTATSPATGTSGGSAASADLNGSGSAVATMPMPRGMAFSVQPAETEIPTAPPEVNVSDSEDVFNQLGKDHAQSEKSDNGDAALTLLKKSIGHSAEYVDDKQSPTAEGAKEEKKKVDESKKSNKSDDKEDKKVEEGKETCNECGGLMEDDHQCESQLNEWSNSPQGQSVDEQFKTDLEFMQNIISGGLNKRKVDQTVMPHTKVKIAESKVNGTADAYTSELKKLAGI